MSRITATRWVIALGLALGLAGLGLPVFAGGWAVVTLDQLPANVVAGQPLTIGFMVRQHGVQPLAGLKPKITASTLDTTKDAFTVFAQPDGAAGHYSATLMFQSAARWKWTIDAFGAFPQPMPELTVQAASGAATTAAPALPLSVPGVLGMLGLLGTVGGVAALLRTRAPLAGVVALGAFFVGVIGFSLGTSQPAPVAAAPLADDSPMETGRELFLAKGCIICHQLNAVSEYRKEFSDFAVGPNLSTFRVSPGYLAKWLFKPDALKPNTQMPTLGLSDPEIEALVAFLDANMGK